MQGRRKVKDIGREARGNSKNGKAHNTTPVQGRPGKRSS